MADQSPDLSPICYRARSYVAAGRVEDALDLYGDVLQIDPDNALALADRGTVFAMMKRFDLALNDLERAFALGCVDATVYTSAATLHFELKHYDKALEYFDKAIRLDPDLPLAYYNRSNVHHSLKHYEAAIADLEKCLTLGPDDNFRQLILRRIDLMKAQR